MWHFRVWDCSYRAALCTCLVILSACSEVGEHGRLQAMINADASVRALTVKVDVLVEEQDPNGGSWFTVAERRFSLDATTPWPLMLTIPISEIPYPGRFQLTATARDDNAAVVGQARVIRKMPSRAAVTTLRVHFEAACLRREPCGDHQTCHAGECVDAEQFQANTMPAADQDASPAADGVTSSARAQNMMPGKTDAECPQESAMTCSDDRESAPLVCRSGRWQAGAACPKGEHCTPNDGACHPVAPECVGRTAEETFCDGDVMLVCADSLSPMVRRCAAHERCVGTGKDVKCDCSIGFIQDAAGGCRAATSCDTNNGGCDPLTRCEPESNRVKCGVCPPGYIGEGVTGCQPLLAALEVSGAQLTPALSPNVREYRVQVPLLTVQANLHAVGPPGTQVQIDTHPVPTGERWLSPVLPLGETTVEISLLSDFNVASTYQLTIERSFAELAYIKAGNANAFDCFGLNVSRDGDTIVVSAPLEDGAANTVNGNASDNSATDSGAAYVFVRSGSNWTQQAYLKPTEIAAGDGFGGQVGISKDMIVVGSVRSDTPSGLASGRPARKGAAYTFERQNGNWSQRQQFSASDAVNGDLFGYSVVMDAETIFVAAPLAGGVSAAVGAVYVFTKQNGQWTEVQILKPSTAAAGGMFGSSLWLYPGVLFVGADQELGGAGALYVFARRGEAWVEQQRLAGDPGRNDHNFGWAVAMNGDRLAISASASNDPTSVSPAGSVYLYKRAGDQWVANGVMQAPVARSSDYFGSILCMTDSALVIGASGDAGGARGIGGDPTRSDSSASGAVYIYPIVDSVSATPVYLKASNADSLDGFGYAMTCSEGELVITAPFEASASSGIDAKSASDNAAVSSGAIYVIR